MKYSIEFKNGQFIETLEVDNLDPVRKIWKREDGDTISGLCSNDKDFSEQLESLVDEDVAQDIYNTFDTNTWVADVEDFILISGIE